MFFASLLSGCGMVVSGLSPSGSTAARSVARAVESRRLASRVFVANYAHSPNGRYEVDGFLPDDPSHAPVERISQGVFAPDGIFVDSHGTLYVTNGRMSGDDSVDVYAKNGHRPVRVLTGSFCTFDVIVASDGTVYVADGCGGPKTLGRVLVYAPGETKPSRSFYPGGAPYALTLDAQNNLLRRLQLP
jgi:hypothetical protein